MDDKLLSLILLLRLQAEASLGLFGAPDDKEAPEPQFEAARHFIDLLTMLQEKTKGNLNMEEERSLGNTITELRFRYVQAFDAHQKKASQAEAPAGESAPQS